MSLDDIISHEKSSSSMNKKGQTNENKAKWEDKAETEKVAKPEIDPMAMTLDDIIKANNTSKVTKSKGASEWYDNGKKEKESNGYGNGYNSKKGNDNNNNSGDWKSSSNGDWKKNNDTKNDGWKSSGAATKQWKNSDSSQWESNKPKASEQKQWDSSFSKAKSSDSKSWESYGKQASNKDKDWGAAKQWKNAGDDESKGWTPSTSKGAWWDSKASPAQPSYPPAKSHHQADAMMQHQSYNPPANSLRRRSRSPNRGAVLLSRNNKQSHVSIPDGLFGVKVTNVPCELNAKDIGEVFNSAVQGRLQTVKVLRYAEGVPSDAILVLRSKDDCKLIISQYHKGTINGKQLSIEILTSSNDYQ